MKITFDPAKNDKNRLERGLSFEDVVNFDFESALYQIDGRKNYGEERIRALGFLDKRLCALVFAETSLGIRVISFRKANKREVKQYEQKTKP